ncbi:MAG: M13 family metallopeptidase [Synergistaceae bacterium]|nr:M13 family metallopeptidase [Synergistaceae bacterium]
MRNFFCIFFALIIFLTGVKASTAEPEVEQPWINSNYLGRIKESYDVKAADDFYLAVNKNWLAHAKLKPGKARNAAAFDDLDEELEEKLLALMTDKNLTGHDAELVQNLYALWLDWDARNEAGVSETKKHVEIVKALSNIEELTNYFKSVECQEHGAFLARYSVGFDNDDPNWYNLEIGPTGLMLGDSAEYKELSTNGARQKKYMEGIASYMLSRLGYNNEEIKALLEKAFEFEKKVAAFMMTHNERRDPDAIKKLYTNLISLDRIRELAPKFPLADVLEAQDMVADRMNLQEPQWLKGIDSLYTQENFEGIKAYLIRSIASGGITHSDEKAYREFQKLSNERNGIKENKPDEKLAKDFVHGHLLTPLSKLFVARHVSEETRRDVTNIINETIAYYRDMLANEEWLSPETREKAVEKLNTLTPRVAYPDKWRDYSGLSIGTKAEGETLQSALDKMHRFEFAYSRSLKNTRVDREMWGDADILLVNSYYIPSMNEVCIIAGILGGDFYNPERSREENLGGIGTVIGHEISHAFDTNGAQYDKNGSIKNWWTEQDYKAFQARADRLINYLNGFIVTQDGQKYNGKLVQTETIADMAGVKAMLGIAEKIIADGGTFDYKKFFEAYARAWRLVQTPERIDLLLKFDVHALNYIRVNAIVQQYEKFYEAYNVKSGDKMYLAPENRVALW